MLSCLSQKRWTDSLGGVGLAGVLPPEASALVSPCDLRDSRVLKTPPSFDPDLCFTARVEGWPVMTPPPEEAQVSRSVSQGKLLTPRKKQGALRAAGSLGSVRASVARQRTQWGQQPLPAVCAGELPSRQESL